MKSYTDIEQSKKLAEFLSLESADMKWFVPADNESEFIEEVSLINNKSEYNLFDKVTDWNDTPYVPCWSLTALLEQLKSEIQLKNKQILFLHINKYDDIDYEIRYTNSWTGEVFITEADNPVDACVAMIEKLHELKML